MAKKSQSCAAPRRCESNKEIEPVIHSERYLSGQCEQTRVRYPNLAASIFLMSTQDYDADVERPLPRLDSLHHYPNCTEGEFSTS